MMTQYSQPHNLYDNNNYNVCHLIAIITKIRNYILAFSFYGSVFKIMSANLATMS